MKNGFLTFPSGALSPDPVRLPIIAHTEEWVACEKPAFVSMTEKETSKQEDGSVNLIQAIRNRIEVGVPSFQNFFQDGWGPVYYLEKVCGGVILLARSADALASLKHRYGSNLWKLQFTLFTRNSATEETFACDLPIATRISSDLSFVSHRKGKKARTVFTRLGKRDHLEMWRAELTYARTLQIPLHAAESGLKIAGENRYGHTNAPITRRDLPGNRRPGDERNVLWKDPAYFLSNLEFEDGRKIQSEQPKIFQKLTALFYPPR